MPKVTLIFGALLCALSVIGFIATGFDPSSFTIFIPLVVGLILLVCGFIATQNPSSRKHVMHAAVTVGLLGLLAALGRGVMQLPKLARGEPVDTLPLVMVWSMAILCAIYVVLCVRSFIDARRNKAA